ncbi:unnamed protein product [Malus baccata var. baccata]
MNCARRPWRSHRQPPPRNHRRSSVLCRRRRIEGSETGWIKVRPEEDDLVTLLLEALLAEKSGLANENSNLVRENQCLRQVVEYHQLTSQDLSASF